MEDTTIVKLARHCQLSVEGLKGKDRDRAVIQYWNGAIGALHSVEHLDADWVSRVGHLLIATRGYAQIESLVKEAKENDTVSQR
jgi:hypothetical protein